MLIRRPHALCNLRLHAELRGACPCPGGFRRRFLGPCAGRSYVGPGSGVYQRADQAGAWGLGPTGLGRRSVCHATSAGVSLGGVHRRGRGEQVHPAMPPGCGQRMRPVTLLSGPRWERGLCSCPGAGAGQSVQRRWVRMSEIKQCMHECQENDLCGLDTKLMSSVGPVYKQ
jgi:hypothetical protein